MKSRQTQPEVKLAYRTWGYPLTPIIFLTFSGLDPDLRSDLPPKRIAGRGTADFIRIWSFII